LQTAGTNIILNTVKRKTLLNYFNIFIIYILALVLLFAGVSKIIAPSSLINHLTSAFGFLPGTVIISIVSILPLIEIGLGLLLISSLYKENLKSKRKIILLITAFLFGLFLLYSIYGYIIGLKNDCGCFGNTVKGDFGIEMIIRNSSFFLLTLVAFFITKHGNK